MYLLTGDTAIPLPAAFLILVASSLGTVVLLWGVWVNAKSRAEQLYPADKDKHK